MASKALDDFRAYDFDNSTAWQEYLNRVEVTSIQYDVMLKAKAKWYQRNVDADLDVAAAVEACRSRASQPGSAAGTHAPRGRTQSNTADPQVELPEIGKVRSSVLLEFLGGKGLLRAIQQHRLEQWLEAQEDTVDQCAADMMNLLVCKSKVSAADAEYAVEVLCKAGMDPNRVMANAIKGSLAPATMGQMALARPAVLKKIIASGRLRINQRQVNTGGTLLALACSLYLMGGLAGPEGKVGRPILLKTVQTLLDGGADPDVPDELGSPPLHYAMLGASRTSDPDLIKILYPASDTKEYLHAEVDDICKDVRRSASGLVSEMQKILKDLPASGADDAKSESPAVRRAASILTAAYDKMQNWGDLLEFAPLFHLPQLLHLVNSIGHGLVTRSSKVSPGPDSGRVAHRVHVMPTNAPVPNKIIKQFVQLFTARPDSPGLYVLAHWAVPLRAAIVSIKANLPGVCKGLRTLLNFLHLQRHPKDHPCFAAAHAVFRPVSWIIMANQLSQNHPAVHHPEYFRPLIQYGHHTDLAEIIEMGAADAITQWSVLCSDYRAAGDMLRHGASRPKFLKALEGPVKKIIKAATTDGVLDLKTNQLSTQVITCIAYWGSVAISEKGPEGEALWGYMQEVCRHSLWGTVTQFAALPARPPAVLAWVSKNPSNMPVFGDFTAAHTGANDILRSIKIPYRPSRAVDAAADTAPAGDQDTSPDRDQLFQEALARRLLQQLAGAADEESSEYQKLMAEMWEQAAAQGMPFKEFADMVGQASYTPQGGAALNKATMQAGVQADMQKVFRYDKVCWNCGERKAKTGRALLVCSRCHLARYCGVGCQKAHWKAAHKQACDPSVDPRPVAVVEP